MTGNQKGKPKGFLRLSTAVTPLLSKVVLTKQKQRKNVENVDIFFTIWGRRDGASCIIERSVISKNLFQQKFDQCCFSVYYDICNKLRVWKTKNIYKPPIFLRRMDYTENGWRCFNFCFKKAIVMDCRKNSKMKSNLTWMENKFEVNH